jgi:hypothetical protein
VSRLFEHEQLKVLADYMAQFRNTGWVLVRNYVADRNARNQAAENIKLLSTHFEVKDIGGIAVGHKRYQGFSIRNCLYEWRGIASTSAQNINCAERKAALFEAVNLVSQCETPFLPIGTDLWKLMGSAEKKVYRIRPKREMRISRHNPEVTSFHEGNYVIGNRGVATLNESCCGC